MICVHIANLDAIRSTTYFLLFNTVLLQIIIVALGVFYDNIKDGITAIKQSVIDVLDQNHTKIVMFFNVTVIIILYRLMWGTLFVVLSGKT